MYCTLRVFLRPTWYTVYIYNAAPCSGVRSSERYIQPTTRSPGLPKKHRDYSPGVSHCPQLHRNSVRIPRQAKLIFLVIPEKYRPVFEGPYFGKYRFLFSTSVSNTAVCCTGKNYIWVAVGQQSASFAGHKAQLGLARAGIMIESENKFMAKGMRQAHRVWMQ